MLRASHWSATGTTVSGVEATIMMSTPSLVMRSAATVAARFESDCESFMMMLMGWTWPSPHSEPSLTAAFHWSRQNWSGSPKAANGPVSGATKPILISRPSPSPPPPPPPSSPQALTTPPRPPMAPMAAAPTPAVLRKSRRVSDLSFIQRTTGVSERPSASLPMMSSPCDPVPRRRADAGHGRHPSNGLTVHVRREHTPRTADHVQTTSGGHAPSSGGAVERRCHSISRTRPSRYPES